MELEHEIKKLEAAKQQVYLQNIIQTLSIIFLASQGGTYTVPENEFKTVDQLIKNGLIFEFHNINGELQVSLKSTSTDNNMSKTIN